METYYTHENTTGYTDGDLALFNMEMDAWLCYAATWKGADLTEDERHEVIKCHNAHVAQR